MSGHLAVTGATVSFGDRPALDRVDLEVAPAEVVAILGPSGCGKSTLLRAIAGLQRLDAGDVHLDGRDLRGVPPHRRGVGLMFQDHALFPHRDVAANVGFGLRMQRRSRDAIAARVGELLGLVGLAGMGDRRVQTLSGGEQQRVALARALAPEPRLLLLDEPLGALDRTLRERLTGELQALFRSLGLTVVTVTHDQAEAFALADRLVVMGRGRVLRSGTPARVWDDPRHVDVARVLGFGNLLDATVGRGVATTRWGPIPVDGADAGAATVLVRPAGVRIVAAGGVAATVDATVFAGERTTLRLRREGAPPLEASVATAEAPSPGDPVQVRLDHEACRILEA